MAEAMSEETASSWYDDAPITDEQIESVRRDLDSPPAERGAAFAPFVVRKMLAEIDRLRAQVAEIGETKAEWAADGPAGWFQSPAGASSEWSERLTRGVVEGAAKKGVEAKLKRRLVGGWRDAE